MRKYSFICLFIFVSLIFSSCNYKKNEKNSKETIEDINISVAQNENSELLLRVENIEKELSNIKNGINSSNNFSKNYGAIINSIENTQGDNIFLGMNWDGRYLNEVYIKLQKENNKTHSFYLVIGDETDGVLFFDKLIKPQYDKSFNHEEYGLDSNEINIYKLITSKINYNENSVMLIIILDSDGKERSQLLHSQKFEEDI